jgi:gp16 family phage-associated protein
LNTTYIHSSKEPVRASRGSKSPAAAKHEIQAQGLTLKAWAEAQGFKYRTVSEVVRGVNKGHYGEGHRVAVALGIK